MKLLRGTNNISELHSGTVATIGNFDGVHRGHQALLKSLRAQAERLQLPTLVVLFEPQPSEYFKGKNAPSRLDSLREKLQKLGRFGIDYVYCIKFDDALSAMSPLAFAQQYLFSRLQIKHLMIGKDFRFGHQRQGDALLLQEIGQSYDCMVDTFLDFSLDNERVSSTQIRVALKSGELDRAADLLGRSYSMCGRVVKGDGRGRQWGIPTANLDLHRPNLPLSGVYCVNIKRVNNEVVSGVANVGTRPTVDGSKNILEVHLLDFNKDIYGEMLEVNFLYKLRDEIKFSSVNNLLTQIYSDITTARTYFDKLFLTKRLALTGLTQDVKVEAKNDFNEGV